MRHWMLLAGRAVLVLGILSTSHLHAQDLSTVSPTIPVELVSDFLVVIRGQIGDLDGLKFIVDTGATHSAIDRKVADRLHLQRRAGEVMNFDRHIPVEWADIPELRVGPIRAKAVRVMVIRLAEYSVLAENVDGIIGLDLLSRSKKFTIDYEKRTLSFVLADEAAGDRAFSGCLVLPIVIQGLPIHLLVDTGFQGILLYKDRLRKRLPKMRTEGESTKVALGRLRATQVKLAGVQITGPAVVTTVWLMDGPDKGALPGLDGYLGPASLRAKRIEFDFDARILRWQ